MSAPTPRDPAPLGGCTCIYPEDCRCPDTPPADTPSPRPLSEEERALTPDTAWVVWSFYHDAWWGPERSGYTLSLMGAGVYTEAEARKIAALRSPLDNGSPAEEARPLLAAVAAEREWKRSASQVGQLLLTALASEREAGERYKALGARALEQWSERDGIVEIDGFTLTHTDDADLGVWTADDAANDRTATAMFWEDDPYRAAFEWFADRTPSEDAPHV